MQTFLPPDKKLFFTKNDPNDPRLGDLVQLKPDDSQSGPVYFLGGFPDDEGIFNNGGRPGAIDGPDSIRNRLYRMTPPPFTDGPVDNWQLVDVGNLKIEGVSLEQRHEQASNRSLAALRHSPQARWIGLGGGHDYGFPDGESFLEFSLKGSLRPVVINFDAHLDVRPLKQGTIITSGTPFYRLLEKFRGQFDFLEVGLQPYCNSRQHFQWLKEMGGLALPMNQIRSSSLPMADQIQKVLNLVPGGQKRPCFLSVDIDAFSSAVAPGCSQSWPGGMTPAEFFPALKVLCNIFSIRSLGIYEVAPSLDQDEQTAKLASEIIYQFLFPQS